MHDDIIQAVVQMVEESGKPIKTIAEEIGKQYSTLKRELNEFDEGAKLGVELLYPLMVACDGDQPLEYLADRRGYSLKKRKRDNEVSVGPSALVSALSRLMELDEQEDVPRLAMARAVNALIDEAEIILYQRFPEQAAFSRRLAPANFVFEEGE